jgi:hypothetical protein
MAQNEYLKSLGLKLERLDSQVQKLKIKGERAGADLKAGYNEVRADLRLKQIDLRPRFRELRRVSDETWIEFKGGLGTAWDEMKSAVSHAVSRFK